MSIWRQPPDLAAINESHRHTAVAQLGIEFIAVEDQALVARMPVDARTCQPAGLLHGGASALLAETLASCASWQVIDRDSSSAVGVDLNATHVRGVREGHVIGRVTPVHLGRSLHVWSVRIVDESGRMVCESRVTVSVLSAGLPEAGLPRAGSPVRG
jgi:uncharacterized protein (TIGR00369 family)